MSTQYLTQEKIDQLNEEYTELKKQKIPDLAKRIDEARQMGDLSENAEYHAARDDMAWAQSRVKEITAILDNAEVISSGSSGGVVGLGSLVAVAVNGKTFEYTIVGAQEADPLKGRISNESPLGKAFLGAKVGDMVTVEVPAGEQEYEVMDIK